MEKYLKEWLESILVAFIIAFILFFVVWPFYIEGPSMEPNFKNGDRIAVSRILAKRVKRGDIVVCRYLIDEKKGNMIKRVIAIPGDNIEITSGEVFLNGEKLEEDYLTNQKTNGSVNLLLNNNEYFVMGDNRSRSNDSRFIGTITSQQMIGKVIIKWYPFNSIRLY